MNYNKGHLAGRLTADPEQKTTQTGLFLVNFTVAVNRRVKRGEDWDSEASFFDVTMFGKRAETFVKWHKKGSPTFLEYHLQMDKWMDKATGQPRQRMKIVADSWEFVSGKTQGDSDAGEQRNDEEDNSAF